MGTQPTPVAPAPPTQDECTNGISCSPAPGIYRFHWTPDHFLREAGFTTVWRTFLRVRTGPGPPPGIFRLFPVFWLLAMGGWIANATLGVVYGIRAKRAEWAGYPIIGNMCLPKNVS
jgi:hypothetical protein